MGGGEEGEREREREREIESTVSKASDLVYNKLKTIMTSLILKQQDSRQDVGTGKSRQRSVTNRHSTQCYNQHVQYTHQIAILYTHWIWRCLMITL